MLESEKNITLREMMVEELIIEDDTVKGVILGKNNEKVFSETVILATGTFLSSRV